MKDSLYIHDSHFNHAPSSSWYNEPNNFVWVRNYNEDFLIFTDNSVKLVDNYKNNKKYAWLLESPEITSSSYDYVLNNHHKFDLIFTFDKNLLDVSKKFILTPIGGCWINKSDRIVHKKTKNVSMIMSNKKQTSGHNLRHQIYNNIKDVDYYGFMNPVNNKIESLKDYKFSIVVENHKKDFYFTEKIIDCFVTGTIPIYWGCPSIGDFFDIKGIINFDTLEDLTFILNNINKEYENRIDSVLKNYELCQNYILADNKIYEKIKKFL